MSLGEDKKLTYLTIMNGRVVQRVGANAEGALSRVNKKGDTVWERTFGYVVGTIEKIELMQSQDYDDQYKIFLTDFESKPIEEYGLFIGKSGLSSVTAAVIGRLRVIDFSKPVMIAPFLGKNNKGEEKTYCTVKQKNDINGKWEVVPQEFTKDNPGDMPPLDNVTFNGKQSLDGTRRLAFYDKMVADANAKLAKIMTELGPQLPERDTTHIEKGVSEMKNEAAGDGTDDLPF